MITEIEKMQIRWMASDGGVPAFDIAKAFSVPTDAVMDIVKGVEHRSTIEADQPLDVAASQLLHLMENPPPRMHIGCGMQVDWRWFDGALVPQFCHDVPNVPRGVQPPDVSYRVNSAMMHISDVYGLQIQRLRSATAKELRGRIHGRFASYPGLFEYGLAAVISDRLVAQRHCLAFGNGAWADPGVGYWRPKAGSRADGESARLGGTNRAADTLHDQVVQASVLLGLEFASYYEWRAKLRLVDGHMSASFFVTPASVRDLFKLRDVPEGKKRRDALIHWVTGHWRRKPDGDDAAWVRKHLRGATSFKWGALAGTITPSADALAELAKGQER